MRVLMITSQWPTPKAPEKVPFMVQQVAYLRQAGVDVTMFAFSGHKNPLNYARAWRRLRRTHTIGAFDVVHAQFGQSGVVALPRQRPLVVTFHGSDLQGIVGANGRYTWAGLLNRWLSQLVARRADQRIVVAERLQRRLPAGRPTHVIPGGINLARFQPGPQVAARRRLELPPEKRLVLFAADPRRAVKRFSLAQQAVALVANQFDVELVTIADVPHPQVPDYMNACDVLLLTSRHEGSPTVVKEALACNLPVVTVDVGDVRRWLTGLPGCTVCVDDAPTTISRALAARLATPGRIDARQRVLTLDEKLVTQKIIAVYEAALAGDPRPDKAT